ncbi:MAG: uracil phosphoribosyltransferase, partial [Planctomycetota bacterium]
AKPRAYYHKLPPDVGETEVIVTDPMLATGGSAIACIDFLLQQGVPEEQLRFMCIVAAPEGVQRLQDSHPTLPIYAAAVDRELNDINYIVPGLGDAGDRIFGT